ncbi:hypothetical protein [Psychroflexus sp. MES1-P1E]|uniref:hypothetical protein n=1 Tax=Psychroflexus sp. MES1-P1E TaxID=2058320 RepID=UPI0011AE9F6A|nr:hypothetical protein [Psychroflexus sp. MES1-P1E]
MKNKYNIGEKTTIGKSDKVMCPIYCKNHYHKHLQKETVEINGVLKRNYALPLELVSNTNLSFTYPL